MEDRAIRDVIALQERIDCTQSATASFAGAPSGWTS
jgi:hypothetical protein